MSYAASAALFQDQEFIGRLSACLCTEAQAKPTEDISQLILSDTVSGTWRFMPYITTAPGFADAYEAGGQESITDGMLLAAVQSVWSSVAASTGGA